MVASGGFERVFDYPFFNEFLLKSKKPILEIGELLLKNGYIPPLPAGVFLGDESLENTALFCATEIFSRAELDRVVKLIT